MSHRINSGNRHVKSDAAQSRTRRRTQTLTAEQAPSLLDIGELTPSRSVSSLVAVHDEHTIKIGSLSTISGSHATDNMTTWPKDKILLESATDAFYHAVRTWKMKFLLDFDPPHASWSARSLALFLHGSISELQEDANELIVLDFLLKYTGDLEKTKRSPAWIVTCGSLLQHCSNLLKKTPRDHDQTFFCITSEDYSKRMHANDQRHRMIVCASDEDEVKFRIAFQAVFCFQLQLANSKAVHVVFGGGKSEFNTVKACVDLRVPVICVGGRSLGTRKDVMASLLVSGQRDLMLAGFSIAPSTWQYGTEQSMVAKSFCDKYVPLLLNVLVGEERNCISADDVIAVSHFLYCIQSPYLLGIECPSTSNLSTDSHLKMLKNRIFSLIDGINDSNPLKEAFFADPSVDPTAARYLYSPDMHANVRQFVLSGWKTEKLQMELEEADFAKQYQRYTSYVLERRRWTFGSLVFPSTPSMPASISSVLLCTTFSPTVVNVFEFMQREWGLPVPRMLLSVIGSSEFQGPLPNREKTLNFLQYDILKALESYYGSFWTITGGCGDTAALIGSALTKIGSTSSLIGISSYGSSDLKRSDVARLESPVEIHVDSVETSNIRSCTPLDINHPYHISVGGSRSKTGDEWSFRRSLQNEVCNWNSQAKGGPCAFVSLLIGGSEESALHVLESIRNRQHVLVLNKTRQMAEVLSFAVYFFSRKSRSFMVSLEGLSIPKIDAQEPAFPFRFPIKRRDIESKLWVKSLVFTEEGGRKVECLAIENQFDHGNDTQRDNCRAVCELDKDGSTTTYSAMINVKPIGAISSIELVLEITPQAPDFDLANIKIFDPAYPSHPLLYSASFTHRTDGAKPAAGKTNFAVCTVGIRCLDQSPPASTADNANEKRLSGAVVLQAQCRRMLRMFVPESLVDYLKKIFGHEYNDFVKNRCKSFGMELGTKKISLKEDFAYYIVEGTLMLTVNNSITKGSDNSRAEGQSSYNIYRVPPGQVLFRNSDTQFSVYLDSIEALERCRIIRINMLPATTHRKEFCEWLGRNPQVTSAFGELFLDTTSTNPEFSVSVTVYNQDSRIVSASARHLTLISKSRLEQEMSFAVKDIQEVGNLRMQVDLWRKFVTTNRSEVIDGMMDHALTHIYSCEFHGNFIGSVRLRLFGNEFNIHGANMSFLEFPDDASPPVASNPVEIGKCLPLIGKYDGKWGNSEWLGDTLSLHLQILDGSGSIDRITVTCKSIDAAPTCESIDAAPKRRDPVLTRWHFDVPQLDPKFAVDITRAFAKGSGGTVSFRPNMSARRLCFIKESGTNNEPVGCSVQITSSPSTALFTKGGFESKPSSKIKFVQDINVNKLLDAHWNSAVSESSFDAQGLSAVTKRAIICDIAKSEFVHIVDLSSDILGIITNMDLSSVHVDKNSSILSTNNMFRYQWTDTSVKQWCRIIEGQFYAVMTSMEDLRAAARALICNSKAAGHRLVPLQRSKSDHSAATTSSSQVTTISLSQDTYGVQIRSDPQIIFHFMTGLTTNFENSDARSHAMSRKFGIIFDGMVATCQNVENAWVVTSGAKSFVTESITWHLFNHKLDAASLCSQQTFSDQNISDAKQQVSLQNLHKFLEPSSAEEQPTNIENSSPAIEQSLFSMSFFSVSSLSETMKNFERLPGGGNPLQSSDTNDCIKLTSSTMPLPALFDGHVLLSNDEESTSTNKMQRVRDFEADFVQSSAFEFNASCVIVVFGGDQEDLSALVKACRSNNGVYIVVVQGSGGIADVIVNARRSGISKPKLPHSFCFNTRLRQMMIQVINIFVDTKDFLSSTNCSDESILKIETVENWRLEWNSCLQEEFLSSEHPNFWIKLREIRSKMVFLFLGLQLELKSPQQGELAPVFSGIVQHINSFTTEELRKYFTGKDLRNVSKSDESSNRGSSGIEEEVKSSLLKSSSSKKGEGTHQLNASAASRYNRLSMTDKLTIGRCLDHFVNKDVLMHRFEVPVGSESLFEFLRVLDDDGLIELEWCDHLHHEVEEQLREVAKYGSLFVIDSDTGSDVSNLARSFVSQLIMRSVIESGVRCMSPHPHEDRFEETSLMLAAANGEVDVTEAILSRNPATSYILKSSKHHFSYGQDAFFFAIANRHPEIACKILTSLKTRGDLRYRDIEKLATTACFTRLVGFARSTQTDDWQTCPVMSGARVRVPLISRGFVTEAPQHNPSRKKKYFFEVDLEFDVSGLCSNGMHRGEIKKVFPMVMHNPDHGDVVVQNLLKLSLFDDLPFKFSKKSLNESKAKLTVTFKGQFEWKAPAYIYVQWYLQNPEFQDWIVEDRMIGIHVFCLRGRLERREHHWSSQPFAYYGISSLLLSVRLGYLDVLNCLASLVSQIRAEDSIIFDSKARMSQLMFSHTDNLGQTALHHAVRSTNHECVSLVLDFYKVHVGIPVESDLTSDSDHCHHYRPLCRPALPSVSSVWDETHFLKTVRHCADPMAHLGSPDQSTLPEEYFSIRKLFTSSSLTDIPVDCIERAAHVTPYQMSLIYLQYWTLKKGEIEESPELFEPEKILNVEQQCHQANLVVETLDGSRADADDDADPAYAQSEFQRSIFWRAFPQMLFYLIFLILVSVCAILMTNGFSFGGRLASQVSSQVLGSQVLMLPNLSPTTSPTTVKTVAFHAIGSIQDIGIWATNGLAQFIWPNDAANNNFAGTGVVFAPMMSLWGAVRVRQIRIPFTNCSMLAKFDSSIAINQQECFDYPLFALESPPGSQPNSQFVFNIVDANGHVQRVTLDYAVKSDFFDYGNMYRYPDRGYDAFFGSDNQGLEKWNSYFNFYNSSNTYIDSNTRAIIIDATLVDPSISKFVAMKFFIEFPVATGVVVRAEFREILPPPSTTWLVIIQFLICAYNLWYILCEIPDFVRVSERNEDDNLLVSFAKNFTTYITSDSNFMDVREPSTPKPQTPTLTHAQVSVFLVFVALFVMQYFSIQSYHSLTSTFPGVDAFVSFSSIIVLNYYVRILLCFYVLTTFVKFLKYMMQMPVIGGPLTAIIHTFFDSVVLVFLLLFLVIVCAFSVSRWVGFGIDEFSTTSYQDSFFNVYSTLVGVGGDFGFLGQNGHQSLFGSLSYGSAGVYFLIVTAVGNLIVMNLVVGIFTDRYSACVTNFGTSAWRRKMVFLLAEHVVSCSVFYPRYLESPRSRGWFGRSSNSHSDGSESGDEDDDDHGNDKDEFTAKSSSKIGHSMFLMVLSKYPFLHPIISLCCLCYNAFHVRSTLIFDPVNELVKIDLQTSDANLGDESEQSISNLVDVCICASEGKKHLTAIKIRSSIVAISKLARKDFQMSIFRAGAVPPLVALIAANGQKYTLSAVDALGWLAVKKPDIQTAIVQTKGIKILVSAFLRLFSPTQDENKDVETIRTFNSKESQRAQRYLVAFLNVVIGSHDAMTKLIEDDQFQTLLECVYSLEGTVASDQCREFLTQVFDFAKANRESTCYKKASKFLQYLQEIFQARNKLSTTISDDHHKINLNYMIALISENFEQLQTAIEFYVDLHFKRHKACRDDIFRSLDKLSVNSAEHQAIILKSVFQPIVIQEMLVELMPDPEDYNVSLEDMCTEYKMPGSKTKQNNSENSALYWPLFRLICKSDGSFGAQIFFANIASENLIYIQRSRNGFGCRDPYIQAVIDLFQDIGYFTALDHFLDCEGLKVEYGDDQKKSFYSESLPVVEAWLEQQCKKAQKVSAVESSAKAMTELMAYLERVGHTLQVAPASLIFRDKLKRKLLPVKRSTDEFMKLMLLKLKSCVVVDSTEQYPLEVFCRHFCSYSEEAMAELTSFFVERRLLENVYLQFSSEAIPKKIPELPQDPGVRFRLIVKVVEALLPHASDDASELTRKMVESVTFPKQDSVGTTGNIAFTSPAEAIMVILAKWDPLLLESNSLLPDNSTGPGQKIHAFKDRIQYEERLLDKMNFHGKMELLAHWLKWRVRLEEKFPKFLFHPQREIQKDEGHEERLATSLGAMYEKVGDFVNAFECHKIRSAKVRCMNKIQHQNQKALKIAYGRNKEFQKLQEDCFEDDFYESFASIAFKLLWIEAREGGDEEGAHLITRMLLNIEDDAYSEYNDSATEIQSKSALFEVLNICMSNLSRPPVKAIDKSPSQVRVNASQVRVNVLSAIMSLRQSSLPQGEEERKSYESFWTHELNKLLENLCSRSNLSKLATLSDLVLTGEWTSNGVKFNEPPPEAQDPKVYAKVFGLSQDFDQNGRIITGVELELQFEKIMGKKDSGTGIMLPSEIIRLAKEHNCLKDILPWIRRVLQNTNDDSTDSNGEDLAYNKWTAEVWNIQAQKPPANERTKKLFSDAKTWWDDFVSLNSAYAYACNEIASLDERDASCIVDAFWANPKKPHQFQTPSIMLERMFKMGSDSSLFYNNDGTYKRSTRCRLELKEMFVETCTRWELWASSVTTHSHPVSILAKFLKRNDEYQETENSEGGYDDLSNSLLSVFPGADPAQNGLVDLGKKTKNSDWGKYLLGIIQNICIFNFSDQESHEVLDEETLLHVRCNLVTALLKQELPDSDPQTLKYDVSIYNKLLGLASDSSTRKLSLEFFHKWIEWWLNKAEHDPLSHEVEVTMMLRKAYADFQFEQATLELEAPQIFIQGRSVSLDKDAIDTLLDKAIPHYDSPSNVCKCVDLILRQSSDIALFLKMIDSMNYWLKTLTEECLASDRPKRWPLMNPKDPAINNDVLSLLCQGAKNFNCEDKLQVLLGEITVAGVISVATSSVYNEALAWMSISWLNGRKGEQKDNNLSRIYADQSARAGNKLGLSRFARFLLQSDVRNEKRAGVCILEALVHEWIWLQVGVGLGKSSGNSIKEALQEYLEWSKLKSSVHSGSSGSAMLMPYHFADAMAALGEHYLLSSESDSFVHEGILLCVAAAWSLHCEDIQIYKTSFNGKTDQKFDGISAGRLLSTQVAISQKVEANDNLQNMRRKSQLGFISNTKPASQPKASRRKSIAELEFLKSFPDVSGIKSSAADAAPTFRKPLTSMPYLDFVQYVEALENSISRAVRGCPEAHCALGDWYNRRARTPPKLRSGFFSFSTRHVAGQAQDESVDPDILIQRAELCYSLAGGLPCALSRLGCIALRQSTDVFERETADLIKRAMELEKHVFDTEQLAVMAKSRKLLDSGLSLIQRAADCGFEEAVNVLVHWPIELPLKELLKDSDKSDGLKVKSDGLRVLEECDTFQPLSKSFWDSLPLPLAPVPIDEVISTPRQDNIQDLVVPDDEKAAVPIGFLRVLPSVSQLFVEIGYSRKGGYDGYQLVGIFSCDSYLSFRSTPSKTVLECRPFCIPGESVSPADLKNGTLKRGQPRRSNAIELPMFTVVQGTDGSVNPDRVATGAQLVSMNFTYKDADVKGGDFTGTFLPTGSSTPLPIRSTTSVSGNVSLLLPAGQISGCVVTPSTGKVMEVKHDVTVSTGSVTGVSGTQTVNVIQDSKVVARMEKKRDRSRPVAICGDSSGSMSEGSRMEALRHTIASLYREVSASGAEVALCNYTDEESFWFNSSGTPTLGSAGSIFLSGAGNDAAVESWASSIKPDHCSNIEMVCRHAAQFIPNVGDIYVMCDGDVSPFAEGDSDGKWTRFRAEYPKIKFHMVALDRSADKDTMSKMASIGNGSFAASTL